MKKALITISIILTIALGIAGWLYFVKGYVGVRKRPAVPEALMHKARIPGFKNIRLIVDPLVIKSMKMRELMDASGLAKPRFNNPSINVLAVSGGGANGAYGAGVLCGWTETGKRPEFDIVTGVSTGALTAPAAFLGPSYDGVIQRIYTHVSDADIMAQDFIDFFLEGRPSLLDTRPLRGLLREVVTKKVLEDVAAAHAKGRRLYIATTNLDARRFVVWDMGAIATHGTPEALELFRTVMLASAAIPVAFPPVMLKVEAGGRLYDEMHVDGSVAMQIFGPFMVIGTDEAKAKKTTVYAIRNGKIADVPKEVPYKVPDIAGAAFSTLITWQSYGDLYRFSTLAKANKIDFYFTCIPYDFNEGRKSEFDLAYMRKLFYRGYDIARSGGDWIRQAGQTLKEGALPK